METFIKIVLILLLVVLILALTLGFAYFCYWLTLWAGAPKYVAVIVGIAVFVLSGLSANLKKKND